MRRIPPGLAAAGLAALGEQGNATGGGGTADPVTPPSAASESVASGGSLADVTFSAFTDPGGRISSYSASKTNVVGSATISGSGLGPYAISGEADGEVITIELDALDSGGDVLATAVYTGTVGAASGGPSDVVKFADIGGYDFTTTGGTGGSGGAGPHTLPDGTTCTVYEVGTFTGSAAFSGGKLTGSGGDSSNHYIIEFDLGSDTEWVPLWIMGQFTVNAASVATGDLRVWMGEATYTANNVADDLQLISVGTDTMRFRFANSASTFNTVLEMTGLSLGSTDQFEFMFRGHTNAWSTVEGRQGTGSLPAWNDAVMANVNGDVRNAVPSWRRYLRVKVGQNDLDLDLHVQKGL